MGAVNKYDGFSAIWQSNLYISPIEVIFCNVLKIIISLAINIFPRMCYTIPINHPEHF